jgi:hypothetical protein
MRSRLKESITDWWNRLRGKSRSIPRMDSPASGFSSATLRANVNAETFWSRFTGTSRLAQQLRKELAEERELRSKLEGHCAVLRGELDRAHDRLDESLRNERLVYQMQVNVNMQGKYGITPFPGAPAIPDSLLKDGFGPIESDYVDGRSMVISASRSFSERVREFKSKRGGDN